ncbi:MAG: RIP metalloprotease RseP [Candidatus Omnitrophota bacterium]
MISLIVFLFVLGLLIIVHEFGHFIAAKKVGVRVEQFSLGFGKPIFKKKKDGVDYSINAIPLGGFVKLAGDNLEEFKGNSDEYLAKPPGKRAIVIALGPILNYALGFLCFWLIFFVGYPTLTTKVGGLMEGYGAKNAGIEIGDRIIAIDGNSVTYWEDLQKIIHTRKEANIIKLSVLRGQKKLDFNVSVQEKQMQDLIGSKQNVGLIGVTPADDIIKIRHGFFESFFLGAQKTWDLTILTYHALWRMIIGKLSFRESVTGPLGIFYITSKAAQMGIIAVLHLVAVLSISLCIFNLLPLPVLDGGHLVLLLIEKIRKKGLSIKMERIITQFGFSLIIALALLATINDLLRFKDKIFGFLK